MNCESAYGGRRSTDGNDRWTSVDRCVVCFHLLAGENPFFQADKTRVDYLRERKDAIYDNLRDLNFEYLAGKYPEQDYAEQRTSLEDEAAK